MWTMWSVMVAGMVLPSAAPMISTYARTIHVGTGRLHGSTPPFAAGYATVWCGFAVLTPVHSGCCATPLWSPGWVSLHQPVARQVLLLVAGAYQFTGAKQVCLRQCRSPLGFLMNHWRNGRGGATTLGLLHGTLCVGCCWALMAVLFVLGVMNLWRIAVLAAGVLLEKLVPVVRSAGSWAACWWSGGVGSGAADRTRQTLSGVDIPAGT
ncbi:DUF2182 domain-containing protein [Arthrobacter rhombi]|uniref:DUF2182 domain-containing protein n=1 Tax=Arthrobacter rhombi TaxID=71253 RepID=UPI003FD683A6